MPSTVDICNRGLQKLGADRITSLTENSVAARECNSSYEILRDAELRSHPWNFSIKRANLAASAVTPEFYYSYQFPLPSDFIRLLKNETHDDSDDYKIEGKSILSNESGPLEIRYVARVADPNLFDSLFVESLACRIAFELCEKITQSSTKGQQIRTDYKEALKEARRTNAFENLSKESPDDSWITSRL